METKILSIRINNSLKRKVIKFHNKYNNTNNQSSNKKYHNKSINYPWTNSKTMSSMSKHKSKTIIITKSTFNLMISHNGSIMITGIIYLNNSLTKKDKINRNKSKLYLLKGRIRIKWFMNNCHLTIIFNKNNYQQVR